jgi:ATP-dependent Clp protease ATP-binding subunit ClpA
VTFVECKEFLNPT